MKEHRRKGFIAAYIVLFVICLVLVFLIFKELSNKNSTETDSENETSSEIETTTKDDVQEDYKENDTVQETSATEDVNLVSGNAENETSNDNFKEVNESVTAKEYVNLRSSMNQGDDSNIVDVLYNGTVVTRTGITDSGWSRLTYNGQTVYAVSSYLTTDLDYAVEQETKTQFKTQFKEVSDNVTAKELTNLRDIPSIYDPSVVVYQLKAGETVQRTGVSEDLNETGWSRVIYNGQVLYAITSYLKVVNE